MEAEGGWNSFGIRRESMGTLFGISLELAGKCDGFFGNVCGMHRGCWGNEWGMYYELLRIIWETASIHTEPLENLWGLLVGNSFVGKGPNTNRTHPHACHIPYKTALPVPCKLRFGPSAVLFGRYTTFKGSTSIKGLSFQRRPWEPF